MAISYPVRFCLYLIFVIPSSLCSIFNLYYFLMNRALRQALNNHIIIVILFLGLFYDFTDIIWLLYHYRTGYSLSLTPVFCHIWVFIDYAVFVTISILVAWASIERHILVFHQNLVATQTKRFLIHYLPLIIFTMYPSIYYIIIYFILPCDTPIDYTKRLCSLDYCAFNTEFIAQWDNIVNSTIPLFTIVIFSIALLGRVWYSKYRVRQRFQWKNYRKMALQLLSISAIYFLIYFPTVIMYTIYIAGISFDGSDEFFSTGYYLSYFVIIFTPFVCTISLPELRKKFKKITRICGRQARRRVGPETLTMNRLTVGITPVVN